MSILSGELWFNIFVLLILSSGLTFVVILMMHFLMPKKLLEEFFKAPYFKPVECTFFSGFPFSIMRTIMFMRILGFPSSGCSRGLTEAYKLAPVWYRNISKVVVFILIFLLISILLISIGFYIHSLAH